MSHSKLWIWTLIIYLWWWGRSAAWWDPPHPLIICHLTVYQSQRILSWLCERWIFLFYGVINFMRIISLHTDPCFDKCCRWIMYIMCLPHPPRASRRMHHMINRDCPAILPKRVSGGVSSQARHSITETAHSIAPVWHTAIDSLFIVTVGAFGETALNIRRRWKMKKRWTSPHRNIIITSCGGGLLCVQWYFGGIRDSHSRHIWLLSEDCILSCVFDTVKSHHLSVDDGHCLDHWIKWKHQEPVNLKPSLMFYPFPKC